MTDCELYWAAGFLEGEGCFYATDGYLRVTAGQKNREPLDRLQALFGGRIYDQRGRDLFLWAVGAKAEVDEVIAALYPLLSSRRRVQIDEARAKAKNRGRGIANGEKTHCPRGHPYDAVEGAARRCATCRREYDRERCRRWRVRQAA